MYAYLHTQGFLFSASHQGELRSFLRVLASGKQNTSMGPVTKEVREAGPMLTIVRTDISLGTKQAHGRWLESGTLKVPQRAVLTLPCGQHTPVGCPGDQCDGRVY